MIEYWVCEKQVRMGLPDSIVIFSFPFHCLQFCWQVRITSFFVSWLQSNTSSLVAAGGFFILDMLWMRPLLSLRPRSWITKPCFWLQPAPVTTLRGSQIPQRVYIFSSFDWNSFGTEARLMKTPKDLEFLWNWKWNFIAGKPDVIDKPNCIHRGAYQKLDSPLHITLPFVPEMQRNLKDHVCVCMCATLTDIKLLD